MKEFKKSKYKFLMCEECMHEFTSIRKLSYHINIRHYGTKAYYDKWLKEKGEGLCKICGKET